jgi:hypothetical protein
MYKKGSAIIIASLPLLGMAAPMSAMPAVAPPNSEAGTEASSADSQVFLAEESARLEIRASQQAAWATYEAAAKKIIEQRGAQFALDASPREQDPIARLRQAAQRASELGQQLTELADATSALWEVLSADQKAVLTEILRTSPLGARLFGPPPRDGGGPRGPAFEAPPPRPPPPFPRF